jgi:uncharacterized membrane protein
VSIVALQAVGLLLVGLLAGEELVVRYGLHPALSALPDRAHLQARQALVRRLRVLVPIIMIPTVLVGVAVLVASGAGHGLAFRWAGVVALAAFVLFSFLGTVPINIAVNDWDVDDPPRNWLAVVDRWMRIDTFRSSAAILAFVCFVVALTSQIIVRS